MRVNGKELASLLGVTEGCVSQWRSKGLPCTRGPGRAVSYDLEECQSWLSEHGLGSTVRVDSGVAHVQREQPAQADPREGLLHWKTEAARAEVLKRQQENMQRAGTLVDRAGVERASHAAARMLRDALVDVLPAKISLELAALTDPWLIECKLRDAIRAELNAVADALVKVCDVSSPS